jgi:acetone carboxylase gamma subunit
MSEATLDDSARVEGAARSLQIGDAFALRRDDEGVLNVDCAECGHHFGPAERDPKLAACMSERSIADLSSLNAVGMTDLLVARHFFCPSCGLLFAVNVQRKGDPVMLEWSIDAATLPATT